jgi:hypothetical protein
MKALRMMILGLAAATAMAGCAKMPRFPRLNLNEPLDERYNNPAWKQHVEVCAQKHPGYNPTTNMYLDSRGRQKLC